MSGDTRPNGYWQDWRNVEDEIRDVALEYLEQGEGLPTQNDLGEEGLSSLPVVLRRNYDMGLQEAYREVFGIEGDKTRGEIELEIKLGEPVEDYVWREYVERDRTQKEVADDLGISVNMLRNITSNHDIKKGGVKPNGYWKDLENVKNELEEEIDEGEIPNLSNLPSDVRQAIQNHHGGQEGYIQVLSDLGYSEEAQELRKPAGFYEDFDNVMSLLEPVIEDYGRPPTENELKEEGLGSLVTEIQKHHGGLREAYARLGFEVDEKPDGFWKDEENRRETFVSVVEEFLEREGRLPSSEELAEEEQGLLDALQKYEDGFREALVEYGFGDELDEKPHGYWKNRENVLTELEEFLEDFDEDEEPPSLNKVVENTGSLGWAIKFHWSGVQGYADFLNELGYDVEREDFRFDPYERITSAEDFKDFVEEDDVVKDVLEVFGGNEADFADIMSVVYGERVSREELQDILVSPEMSDYLGDKVDPDPSLWKLVETTATVLPMDETGLVRDIFESRAIEYARERLGPHPSVDEMDDFVEDIEQKIEEAEADAMEVET